jgi:hypothetical protein
VRACLPLVLRKTAPARRPDQPLSAPSSERNPTLRTRCTCGKSSRMTSPQLQRSFDALFHHFLILFRTITCYCCCCSSTARCGGLGRAGTQSVALGARRCCQLGCPSILSWRVSCLVRLHAEDHGLSFVRCTESSPGHYFHSAAG